MPVCSRSIRRRDRSAGAPPSFQEQRSAAELDQSPKCSLPWQLQHQTELPCGAAAKSRALALKSRWLLSGPKLETWKSVAKMHLQPEYNDGTAFQGSFSILGMET